MKKQYIQPTSVIVNLFGGEDVMVAMSQTPTDGTEAFSNERDNWSSDDWSASDEEE